MAEILLKRDSNPAATYVSNTFIDNYMTHADGEFVKIYLYLLRCINSPDTCFSISGIADTFDYTEKDVKRALKYWEKMHLLRLEFNADHELSGIYLNEDAVPVGDNQKSAAHNIRTTHNNSDINDRESSRITASPISEKIIPYNPPAESVKDCGSAQLSVESLQSSDPLLPEKNADISAPIPRSVCRSSQQNTDSRLAQFHPDENVQELLYVAERYLGHQLNPLEADTIMYWMDKLDFSQDLIDYLIEQCVAKNRPAIQYMDKIALDWAKHGVHTVSEAKKAFAERSLTFYTVKKAFGISDRSLSDYEKEYVQKWTEEMGFSDEIIGLACQKTLRSIQKINFNYTDSILKSWQVQNVHTLEEIEALDAKHQKMQTKKYAAAKRAAVQASIQASVRSSKSAALNNYNSFSQRTYDYEALERELLTR